MTTGAARRTLNSREIRVQQEAVSVAAETIEDTASEIKKHL